MSLSDQFQLLLVLVLILLLLVDLEWKFQLQMQQVIEVLSLFLGKLYAMSYLLWIFQNLPLLVFSSLHLYLLGQMQVLKLVMSPLLSLSIICVLVVMALLIQLEFQTLLLRMVLVKLQRTILLPLRRYLIIKTVLLLLCCRKYVCLLLLLKQLLQSYHLLKLRLLLPLQHLFLQFPLHSQYLLFLGLVHHLLHLQSSQLFLHEPAMP